MVFYQGRTQNPTQKQESKIFYQKPSPKPGVSGFFSKKREKNQLNADPWSLIKKSLISGKNKYNLQI